MDKFSVLMSIYEKESPKFLQKSLESIFTQTILPNEVVIVKDGVLPKSLEDILHNFAVKYEMIKFLPLKENKGLGLALREGVLACSNELIARMDTDDIAKPDRFEKQLNFLNLNQDISLLGTCIEEFSIDENYPDTKTYLPLNHEDIVKFAKKRNPFRHMTVFFKKTAVLESGSYRDFLWFEDYDLWVRMIQKGYKTANLPEILVSVRADEGMFARRGGWNYLKQDIKFQRELYMSKYILYYEYVFNIVVRIFIRLLPNKIRVLFYKLILRK